MITTFVFSRIITRIFNLFLLLFSFFFVFSPVFADSQQLTFKEFLNVYVQATTKNIDNQYTDVTVKYQNVVSGTMLYDTLQRAIYLKILPNMDMALDFDIPVKEVFIRAFFKNDKKYFPNSFSTNIDDVNTDINNKYVDISWTLKLVKNKLTSTKNKLYTTKNNVGEKTSIKIEKSQSDILKDIATTLSEKYLYSDNLPDYKKFSTVTGFLKRLGDPYTTYFTPKLAKKFTSSLRMELVGIGVYLQYTAEGKIFVARVFSGGGAEKAGIQVGDTIVEIDNVVFGSKDNTRTFLQFIDLLKGKEGTKVEVYIKRGNEKKKLLITRKLLHVSSVETSISKKGVCVVNILMFSFGAYKDFSSAIAQLDETGKCKGYAFDLRGNPGGSMHDALQMLGYFVPGGKTVFTIEDKDNKQKYSSSDLIYSKYGHYFRGKKLFLFINRSSASAAEVFVSVIKDYLPNSYILGAKSFGKGTVQDIKQYDDGGLLKYTIAKWLTGKSAIFIGGYGIVPDIYLSDDPSTEIDELLEWAEYQI